MCQPPLTHCTSHQRQHRAQQRIQPHLLFLNPLFHRLRITHLMLLLPFHFTSQPFKGPRFMHNNPLIPLPRHSRCNALCESKTRRIVSQVFPRCIDIYPAVVLKQSASSHITLPILRVLTPVILHTHLEPRIRKIKEKAPFRRISGRTSTTPNIHPIRHIHPEIHIWHRQAMCHQQQSQLRLTKRVRVLCHQHERESAILDFPRQPVIIRTRPTAQPLAFRKQIVFA